MYQSTLGQTLGGLKMAGAQGEANVLRQGGQAAAQRWTNFGQLGSLPISTMKQMEELEDRTARMDYMQTQSEYMGMLGEEAKVRKEIEERKLANTTMFDEAMGLTFTPPTEEGGQQGRDWDAGAKFLNEQGRPDLLNQFWKNKTETVNAIVTAESNELTRMREVNEFVTRQLAPVLDPQTGGPAEWTRRRDPINEVLAESGQKLLPEVYDREILQNAMKAGVAISAEYDLTQGMFNEIVEGYDASSLSSEFELVQQLLSDPEFTVEGWNDTFALLYKNAPEPVRESMIAGRLHEFDPTDPTAYQKRVINWYNAEDHSGSALENYTQHQNDFSSSLAGLIEAKTAAENVINGIPDREVGSPAPTYGQYGDRLQSSFFGADVPGDMQFPYTEGPLARASQHDRLKPLFDKEVLQVFNEFRRKQDFPEWAQLPEVDEGMLLLRSPKGQEEQVSVFEAQGLLNQGATIVFNPEWLVGMPRWLPSQQGSFPTNESGTRFNWGAGPGGGATSYGTGSVGIPR